jgi:PGF-pre-PGF domain-containing protein
MKNNFISLFLALIILMASTGFGSAAEIIANNTSSIQAAANNSTSNGTIIDTNGTYIPINENNSISNGTIIDNNGTYVPIIDNKTPIENITILPYTHEDCNILAKEVAYADVICGENTTFNFTKNLTCVESLTFITNKTLGNTSATVEELKNKDASIPDSPVGEIYKFFNVLIGNGDIGCIRNASINFSVNNSWIQENNINQSSIVLNEYNNTSKEWEQLPVNLTGNDCQKLHFVGNVSNYSSFAITGNESTNESDVC